MSQSNQIDLRMFCEKLPFDSLFSNESCIFPVRFLYLENVPCKILNSGKKMKFGTTPKRCGIHSNAQSLLQNTCLFYTSETLAVYIGVCL